jgi:L-rhamnose 1-dehydrogenase
MVPTPDPRWKLLRGKTAAITGGTTGIGAAITKAFLEQGCRVAVNYLAPSSAAAEDQLEAFVSAVTGGRGLDSTKLGELGGGARLFKSKQGDAEMVLVPGDVSRPETGPGLVREAVERWGGLDVFVSNAGVCEFTEFLE